ncbi:erythromycin esterase family protein [Rufibacter sediminis]|uniref:Erythromycin esterase family protein n=1 Tax=Rufibacter sediminis TaxID=2762756 RepID=A0ABR6VP09_9BACT|nr:erythromycin esterase family protein [Rufibacter sediminis]MBC3538871.1 erythromycin esterase family protein [Rufibacter sediminis]
MNLTSTHRLLIKCYPLLLVLLLFAHTAVCQYPKRVEQEIQQYFIPFSDSSAALPSAFLEKLKDKTIVGLGEATHGTAEFERMFSLLSKELILKQGFNCIVLAEANFYDTRSLNDYVVYGKGEAETVIRLMRHQPNPLVEEEFRRLAEWVRSHNEKLPVEERVWMLGADAMSPRGAAYDALRLCRELKVNLPEETVQLLSEISVLPESMFEDYAKRNTMASVLSRTAQLQQALQHQASSAKLDARQRWLLQSVGTLDLAIRFFYDNYLLQKWSTRQFRDEAMLSNIQWVLKERPRAKLIVYAHNAHLEKKIGYQSLSGFGPYLGGQLDSTYGKKYYAICTEAQSGTYWAGDDDGDVAVIKKKTKVGDILGGIVKAPFGFLELTATRSISKYFASPLDMTFGVLVGSNNSSAKVNNLASAFDALLFVRKSTPKLRTKPKTPLRMFSLNLNMSPDLIRKIASKGEVTVSLNGSFVPSGTSLSGEGVVLGVLFLNGDKKVLGYHAAILSGKMDVGQAFKFPAGTEKVLLTFSGSSIKELGIQSMRVNGQVIALNELSYFGEGYDKSIELDEAGNSRIQIRER